MTGTLKSEKQSVVPFCLVTSEFKEAQKLNVGTFNRRKTSSGGLLPNSNVILMQGPHGQV